MASNVAIRITADVVDLQAKFAVAKAESRALTGEMNKLAPRLPRHDGHCAIPWDMSESAQIWLGSRGVRGIRKGRFWY